MSFMEAENTKSVDSDRPRQFTSNVQTCISCCGHSQKHGRRSRRTVRSAAPDALGCDGGSPCGARAGGRRDFLLVRADWGGAGLVYTRRRPTTLEVQKHHSNDLQVQQNATYTIWFLRSFAVIWVPPWLFLGKWRRWASQGRTVRKMPAHSDSLLEIQALGRVTAYGSSRG